MELRLLNQSMLPIVMEMVANRPKRKAAVDKIMAWTTHDSEDD